MVTLLGKTMSTSSFAMYTFAAAVLVQALTLVCFSSFADHGMFVFQLLILSRGFLLLKQPRNFSHVMLTLSKDHIARSPSCYLHTLVLLPAVSSSSSRPVYST
jgi:hypothetical protein